MAIVRGDELPELVLKGGEVVNVFSGEVYPADVAVDSGRVIALGDYRGKTDVDVAGRGVCPGFIDSHVHIESSMVTIPEFARAVVPRGTTTVVIDPHEIANVMGLAGIAFMLKTSKYQLLNVYVMLSSCVPASSLETSGSELRALDLFPYIGQEWILGLGEMMNFPGVLACDPEVMDKLKLFQDSVIDGHAPGLTGRALNGYVAMGIRSDHECTTASEAMEKIRLGMSIMIREGGTAKNLLDLLPAVTPSTISRCLLCSDDRNPADLLEEGHIDFMIRKAIRAGLDPVSAIRMASANPAQYFRLRDTGAVAPGFIADLAVVDNLRDFRVVQVYKSGVRVAEDGRMVKDPPDLGRPHVLRGSINIQWLKEEFFRIPARGRRARVIRLIPDQIITGEMIVEPTVREGKVAADPERDLLKLAVVERHLGSPNLGLGLVSGFGLKKGAIASSVAHDSHNIIVVGTNDADMMEAVVKIRKIQGGFTVVVDGKLVGKLPLPIAGLMSDQPLETVREELNKITALAHELGVTPREPFMALSFLALPVIPKLKLTDRGLVDVDKFKIVDLFVD
ncbi:MAG: adenine deaminase [Candidatus Aureabacteria bacterium]|nr:adenine deaminase [Candidatus Auribacterota bacterium]